MKIAIIAYRSWSAARRYRSLALNAVRLGHQVWGFTGEGHSDGDLTIAIFKELGVRAFHGHEIRRRLPALDPDLVCGERYHHRWPTETFGQDWVNGQMKVGFLLNHLAIKAYAGGNCPGPRTHFLAANEWQAKVRLAPRHKQWDPSQVHILGVPGFDFVTESMDVSAIRKRLGAQPEQPLIGLFTDFHRQSQSLANFIHFAKRAKQEGWKIVIHPHPSFRRQQNGSSSRTFLLDGIEPALREAQRMGVTLIVDYAPGTLRGIKFQRCTGFELIAAADALLSAVYDPIWEAYIMGKACHFFGSHTRRPDFWHKIVDVAYEEHRSDIDKALDSLQVPGNELAQDPAIIEEYCYKLDGLWWQRALELAERLRFKR